MREITLLVDKTSVAAGILAAAQAGIFTGLAIAYSSLSWAGLAVTAIPACIVWKWALGWLRDHPSSQGWIISPVMALWCLSPVSAWILVILWASGLQDSLVPLMVVGGLMVLLPVVANGAEASQGVALQELREMIGEERFQQYQDRGYFLASPQIALGRRKGERTPVAATCSGRGDPGRWEARCVRVPDHGELPVEDKLMVLYRWATERPDDFHRVAVAQGVRGTLEQVFVGPLRPWWE